MGKQRDAIRMTADEVAALFDASRNLQVATLGADGAPHLTTVWFARDGERLLFETYGKSQKIVTCGAIPASPCWPRRGRTMPNCVASRSTGGPKSSMKGRGCSR